MTQQGGADLVFQVGLDLTAESAVELECLGAVDIGAQQSRVPSMSPNVAVGWKARCRRPSLGASGHGSEAVARAASGAKRLGRGAKRRRELKAGAQCEYCRVLYFIVVS